MKQMIQSVLEALFMPKPNDHLKRNQYGLILIPVQNREVMINKTSR